MGRHPGASQTVSPAGRQASGQNKAALGRRAARPFEGLILRRAGPSPQYWTTGSEADVALVTKVGSSLKFRYR